MSLRKFNICFSKKQKSIFWRCWLASNEFFFEVKGPFGSVIDSIPNVGFVYDVIKNIWFFSDYKIYSLFLSKLESNLAGVCYGYFVDMFLKGLGYRVWAYNGFLYFNIGYSHIISYKLPLGVFVKARKNQILFFSADRALINSTASSLQHFKFPDPYRGKGVRFVDVDFLIKPGKQR